jgi:catechol 2,3-dioxygenase-like lactoylglutathione lyase family enzyme
LFKDTVAFSSFSVDDLEKAKGFYGGTLGLEVGENEGGLELMLGGGARVFVYDKGEDHVPASFTILNFSVPNIEEAVAGLSSRGVTLEHYDGTDESGVNRGDFGPAIAWFKDPAGNFLSVLEGE